MPAPRDRRDSRSPPPRRPRDDRDRERDYDRRPVRDERERERPRLKEESDEEKFDRRRPRDADRDRERERDRGYGRDRDDRRDRGYDDRRDRPVDRRRDGDRARSSQRSPAPRKRSRSPPPPAFPTFGPSGSRSPAPGSRGPSAPAEDKSKPNFNQSGALAAATNTVNGVVLKYNEPPEARKPTRNWRLYVFKGDEQVELLHISRQSAYLVGRDRVVADIPIEHPSCSKQHAVIQYRQVTSRNEFGDTSSSVKSVNRPSSISLPLIRGLRPFIIDLDSTNGTFVNDEEIPKSRFYELKESDVIKFGQSSREYVLLHEDAAA
ncbi:SMAD/FHA domain-containing protein [Calocera cornea HHB12733]|uniref:SMAD/FHA domain-containing protein n=1 Tax=Calocera cornea HHB12733 TaxID=1353952 RepID=A0A165F192_9BASI|nr:SMAD/FHA domain-containing protein [Calocera cornea HHB12733]